MPRHQKVTFGRQKSQLLRPKKSESSKRKRLRVWKKRLAALGLPAEQIATLQYVAARTLLKTPKKVSTAASNRANNVVKAKFKHTPKAKAAAKPKAKAKS